MTAVLKKIKTPKIERFSLNCELQKFHIFILKSALHVLNVLYAAPVDTIVSLFFIIFMQCMRTYLYLYLLHESATGANDFCVRQAENKNAMIQMSNGW